MRGDASVADRTGGMSCSVKNSPFRDASPAIFLTLRIIERKTRMGIL